MQKGKKMNIKIKKTTKSNSRREEPIKGKKISFSSGHGGGFWWNIHFEGIDKNGLPTDIEIQLSEEERVKFLEDFSKSVESWKAHINSKKQD